MNIEKKLKYKYIIMFFYSNTCSCCSELKLKNDISGIKIVKINVDDDKNKDILKKYSIGVIPYFLMLKDNTIIKYAEGFKNCEQFIKTLTDK